MKQLRITKQITTREDESLDRYLTEIGKVNLITIEEEVDLARRIRDGDTAALEKLTKANLRFVVSVAKQYQFRGLPLSDLINEGNVGLMKAGMRFDETRGFKFISYAVWWIRQAIVLAISEQARIVRLPLNRVGSFNKMLRVFSELEQNLERDPTVDELAECMGTTYEFIAETVTVSQRSISTDAPLHFDDDTSLMDSLADTGAIAPDMELMDGAMKQEIHRVLLTLSSREMEVIELYFGLNGKQSHTLDEIGTRFSITRERVRQIKERATHELRKSFRSSNLRTYLGTQ